MIRRIFSIFKNHDTQGFIFWCGLLIMVFVSGYFTGRQIERAATLKAAVVAYQTRNKIDHAMQNMNASDLCVVLGGTKEECQNIREGLK